MQVQRERQADLSGKGTVVVMRSRPRLRSQSLTVGDYCHLVFVVVRRWFGWGGEKHQLYDTYDDTIP